MKKVLLLAAAVLTLGTATAHLGLNGTFGKPVSKAIHKVVESVKVNPQDFREAKTGEAVLAGTTFQSRYVEKGSVRSQVKADAAPMVQVSATERMTLSPAKAAIVKKLAAKAPAAMSEKYKAKAVVYNGTDGKWYWSSSYTMETISFGDGEDYMIDVFPDNVSGDGVPALYTSVENADGTTSITIAPQWIGSNEKYDFFICDYTNIRKGGDGSIKMTLAADGNLTFDNPGNVAGYYLTPVNTDADPAAGNEPPFVGANIVSAAEQCQQVTYTIPEPDTFVAEVKYTGKGFDKSANDFATWDMQMGKKDGVSVIRDLVPSVEGDTGIPTDIVYTENGNQIIIQPQCVGTAAKGKYYLYLLNANTADGVITLTKDANGYLTTADQLDVIIGAFKVDAFDLSQYAGWWTWTEDVKFYAEGQEIPVPTPVAMYEPEYTSLNIGFSANSYLYGTSVTYLPGYAEIPYVNTTKEETTSWSWAVNNLKYNSDAKAYEAVGDPITGTEKDFSFMTQGSGLFNMPTLNEANGDKVSAQYQWGQADEDGRLSIQQVGGSISDEGDSESGPFAASVCHPSFSIASWSALATPDKNTKSDINLIAMYQGKPAAPLYITGLNMYVKDLVMNADFNLTARIVEATRSASGSFRLGKTIAYADANVETSMTSTAINVINFSDLYVLDEDEMSQSLDHLFLDKEFAVVIEGWNNGTFSCTPFGEYSTYYNTNGFSNVLFEKKGEEGSMYSFTNNYGHLCLNFNDGTYGYLHTADNANFTALADGGEAKIHIDDAMYCNVGDNDAVSPRVFVSDDCPEWVTIDTENVDETGTVFDLKFTFDKNDGEARKATFYVWQEGAKIDVTVDQAGTINTGISGITAEGAANGPRYNVAGQRVDASAKGIVISNGKKQIAK